MRITEETDFKPTEFDLSAIDVNPTENKVKVLKDNTPILPYILAILGFHIYLVFAILNSFEKCAWLVSFTALAWTYVIYQRVLLPKSTKFVNNVVNPLSSLVNQFYSYTTVKVGSSLLVLSGIFLFLLFDTWNSQERLFGLVGIFCALSFMIILSKSRGKVKWSIVIIGFTSHFLTGLVLLRWPWGVQQMQNLADIVVRFLDFTNSGTAFVYGFLATPPKICGLNPVLAFTAFQVILFFSAVVSLLYYYNIMQFVMRKVAWFMQRTLGTTAPESFYASTCVFVGMHESVFLIRPYFEKMTDSEIFTILTSGFACVAGSMFTAYSQLGACPIHLISSSIMSAPCSIACSKLLFPETEESQLANIEDLELPPSEESNAIECISNGAMSAINVIAAIVVNLIVFLALLAFIDSSITYLGTLVGLENISLSLLLSYVFFPVAYVMGVTDTSQTLLVSQLLGTKTTFNEFIAYQKMGEMIKENKLSPRAALVSTYALCSFSNFGSIGIQVGMLAILCPSKRQTFARLAPRALLAASVASFYTATIAGILVEDPQICLPPTGSEDCVSIDQLKALINK